MRFNRLLPHLQHRAGGRQRCRALARWGRATGGAEGTDCGALLPACAHVLATPYGTAMLPPLFLRGVPPRAPRLKAPSTRTRAKSCAIIAALGEICGLGGTKRPASGDGNDCGMTASGEHRKVDAQVGVGAHRLRMERTANGRSLGTGSRKRVPLLAVAQEKTRETMTLEIGHTDRNSLSMSPSRDGATSSICTSSASRDACSPQVQRRAPEVRKSRGCGGRTPPAAEGAGAHSAERHAP